MTSEKLERLVQKSNKIFDSGGREVNVAPIGNPVILRGPVVGLELIDKVDRDHPGFTSVFYWALKNKPEEANAYCEFGRWNSEWTAGHCIPSIKVQYYNITGRGTESTTII